MGNPKQALSVFFEWPKLYDRNSGIAVFFPMSCHKTIMAWHHFNVDCESTLVAVWLKIKVLDHKVEQLNLTHLLKPVTHVVEKNDKITEMTSRALSQYISCLSRYCDFDHEVHCPYMTETYIAVTKHYITVTASRRSPSSWASERVSESGPFKRLAWLRTVLHNVWLDDRCWPSDHSGGSPAMFVQWLMLPCCITSKGIMFVFRLMQQLATFCLKIESHNKFS